MDFFERQDRARRGTQWLVIYFIAAVIFMVLGIYVAVALGLSFIEKPSQALVDGVSSETAQRPTWWLRLDVFVVVAGLVLLVITLGSLYKVMELRSGGEAVATMLGGRRIASNTVDPGEKQLLNIVEEMAIASGVPAPPVYVLDKEKSINAFAAGNSIDDAIIGVNRGTINILNRDELQGVIAHEFSHILNGDMRLNLRLIGVLHGILLIGLLGYFLLRTTMFARSRDGKANMLPLLGLVLVVVGFAGLFFGRLIKAAVSRQREFLADASAVQFTRNPNGIAGALKKIGGLAEGSLVESPEAVEAAHMFFGSALRSWHVGWLDTHPPLGQRIMAIDPSFDGNFPQVDIHRRPPVAASSSQPAPATQPASVLPGQKMPFPFGEAFGMGGRIPLDPVVIIGAVGAPTTQHVDFAHNLISSLPPQLAEAIHEPFSARALVYVLLLDRDDQVRATQYDLIAKRDGVPTREETERLSAWRRHISATIRLPFVELLQGTLRQLSRPQYEVFRDTVQGLIEADQKIDMFEFVLQRTLITHLDRAHGLTKPPRMRYPSLRGVLPQAQVVLSSLAGLGHTSEQESRSAFRQAMSKLDDGASLDLLSGRECGPLILGEALDKLRDASPTVKKRILGAATLCVAHDGEVTVAESEVLRAIADSLDCPIPPLVAGSLNT